MCFKICVVGCGKIACSMHGPAYVKYQTENSSVVLAGCCDIDLEKAKCFKAQFGFERAYADMDKMLDEIKPDAVCLISPVHRTAALAANILERRIPLLLEKPPGRTLEEVLCLAETANRTKTPHRVAFNRRYAPLIRALREDMKALSPSQIQSIQYEMFRIGRLDEDFSTTAIHAIDAVKFIAASDYKSVRFTYREYPELGKNVADIHMTCEMESGAAATLQISPVTGIKMERAAVNVLDKTYFLDYMGTEFCPAGRLAVVEKNRITTDISGDSTADGAQQFEREGFYFENKSFFDDILAGRTPDGDLRSAVQSVEVAACICRRESTYIGGCRGN